MGSMVLAFHLKREINLYVQSKIISPHIFWTRNRFWKVWCNSIWP